MALTRPRYSQIPDSDYKNSCRIVTTTDVTLTGSAPLTYDGVTLVQYDRVLVAGQTDKTQNGIYSVSTLGSGSNGTWVRSKDANANDRLTAGMNTFVEEGTYTGQFWHLLTPGPITLGVTELIFGQITGNAAGTSSQVQYNSSGSIAGAANLRYDAATGNVLIGGGTVSTSNITGALTVNGGIGVTGNIWASSNIYSAGSRVLTTYDLETVTFLANYISKDPANVYVPVVGTGTIYGTHNFGNLEAISTYGDYDTVAQSGYYSVNDATGAPGFVVYVGFTGISDFNRAVYNINYTQNSGHTITIDLYNYDTDAWDAFAQYSGSGSWQTFALSVIDPDPYIDTTGNVTTRIYHVSSGSPSHRTWIDYVALEKSITGGSGPRGPVGATGPSGTYSGGYISGTIITGGNIVSNSGNVSISTTTGAIVLTGNGGMGLGGNIFAGGNITASAFYTTNGLFWAGNGLAFSSGLEVSEINAANTLSNISSQVTSIRFDKDTGFSVSELNPGNIKVSLGSSFKTWHVPGQPDLVAAAEDEVTFFGNGIDITTNPTFPKAITFIANNSILEANIGAFYTYANANIGTLFLGNASTQANLGAFQLYANANIGTLFLGNAATQANIGAFYSYANANIGTLYLGNISTQANLGAYQLYANNAIDGTITEITTLSESTTANAATQALAIDALSANINAFQSYANTKIGTNNNSNLVVTSTVDAISSITGAVVVAGGVGIGGNLYVAGNIYAANLTAISISTLSVQDPLLYLTADTPFPYNYDIGFFSHYSKTLGFEQHTGVARDYTNGIWGFFSNLYANPGATVDWTEANLIYDTVRVGDLVASNTTISTSTTTGALRVAGGAGIAGALYITNTGDVSANIGTLYLGNIELNSNLGAFQSYANANIGTLFLGNASTNANLGAFQLYANANIGTLYLGNIELNSNLGAFQSYANTRFATLDANIGTLFLGNTSTQVNLGAFQSYANSTFTTYSNSNVASYLPTYTGNIGAGNIVAISNVSANKFYTTDGIYWTGNGAAYAAGGGGSSFTYTASTTPPVGPVVGDQWYDTAEGILYEYIDDGDTDQWVDLITPTFSSADLTSFGTDVEFRSNITVNGNTYVGNGIYWAGNGVAFASTTYSNANVTAYLTTATGNIAASNIFVNNYRFANGVNILTTVVGTYSNTNVAAYLTLGANIGSGTTTTNLVAAATTTSTSTTTGALVVRGGAGIAGNAYISGNVILGSSTTSNVVAAATTTSTSTTTGALVVQGGVGIAGALYTGGIIDATGNIVADSGVASTSSTTGALIVNGGAGVSGNLFAVGNVVLGSGTVSNVVANATTVSTSTTTGALVVRGGAGIAGRLNVAGNVVLSSGIASTNSTSGALVITGTGGLGVGGVITSAGNIVAGSGIGSTNTTSGALVVFGGVGVSGNVNANALRTATGVYWSGNGAIYGSQFDFTSSSTAPSSPTVGDFWYYTTDQILFQYINDGTTNYWVDVQTSSLNANVSQEIFVGNTTIGGNVTIAANTTVSGNLTILSSIVENDYAVIDILGGSSTVTLSPLNGTMQRWTLVASRSAQFANFFNGSSMTLMIVATAYSISSWSGVSWIGGSAPTLSNSTTTILEFWKSGGTLYGGLVGST